MSKKPAKYLSKTQKYMLVRQHVEYKYTSKTLAEMYDVSVRTIQRILQEHYAYIEKEQKSLILQNAQIKLSKETLQKVLNAPNYVTRRYFNTIEDMPTDSLVALASSALFALSLREQGQKQQKPKATILPAFLDVKITGAKPGKAYQVHPVEALNA